MKVSIIVPVFNEELTIGLVLDRLSVLDFDREVIVVDDGSTDDTTAVIHGHTSDLVIEKMDINRGKGAAIRRGIAIATGEIIVTQDADLEVSPHVIESLVAPIVAGGADVVYGSRFLHGHPEVSITRRFANRFLTALVNRMHGLHLTDMETAHKAMRSDLARSLDLISDGFEIEVELTAKLAGAGARFTEVPSPYQPRSRDEGKKITWRDGLKAITTIWAWRPSRACFSVTDAASLVEE